MNKGWQVNYELGKKAFEEKKYEVARHYLEQVRDERSGFADVHNMLGQIYYHRSMLREAVNEFKKALKINPNYTEVSLSLSVVYNELGEIDNAQAVYNMARDAKKETGQYADPYVKGKLANMHAEIAAIYRDMGNYAEAIDEYKKAVMLRPEFVDLRTKLGAVYRDVADYSSSLKELAEAIRINENYTPARIQLGVTCYAMGQKDRAKAEWQMVLRKKPEDKMAKMYLATLETGGEKSKR